MAKQATGAHERINAISADDIFDISLHHDGAQLDADITDLNSFNEAANPATVLELLDELEAAEKRIAELEARAVVIPDDLDFDCEYENGGCRNHEESWLRGRVDGFSDGVRITARAIRAAGITTKGE